MPNDPTVTIEVVPKPQRSQPANRGPKRKKPDGNPKNSKSAEVPKGNGAKAADAKAPGRGRARGTNGQFRGVRADPTEGKSISPFAASMVWPAQVPGVRYASWSSTEPTALASPWSQIKAPWSSSDEAEEIYAQVSRSLLCSHRVSFKANEAPYMYELYGTNNDHDTEAAPSPTARISIEGGTEEKLHFPWAVCTTEFQPHGPKMYGGNPVATPADNFRFFWLEAGTVFTVTLNMETAGTGIDFIFRMTFWSLEDGFEQAQTSSQTLDQNVPVTFGIAVTTSGYYAFSIFNENAALRVVDVQMSFAASGAVIGHRAIPEIAGKESDVINGSLIGVACMYENTAGPGARAGKGASYQAPAGQDWGIFTEYDVVAKCNGAWSKDIPEGAYRWLKPRTETGAEFEPLKEMVFRNNVLHDCHWDMSSPFDFGVISIQVPAPASTGVGTPKSGVWWFYFAMEYTTNSTWPQKAYASKNVKQREHAMVSLQDIPGGSTNSSHTKLLNNFKKILGTTERALRIGSSVASML